MAVSGGAVVRWWVERVVGRGVVVMRWCSGWVGVRGGGLWLVGWGRVLLGRVRSGRVRLGRVRSGRVRSGRVRSGRVRSGRVGFGGERIIRGGIAC